MQGWGSHWEKGREPLCSPGEGSSTPTYTCPGEMGQSCQGLQTLFREHRISTWPAGLSVHAVTHWKGSTHYGEAFPWENLQAP